MVKIKCHGNINAIVIITKYVHPPLVLFGEHEKVSITCRNSVLAVFPVTFKHLFSIAVVNQCEHGEMVIQGLPIKTDNPYHSPVTSADRLASLGCFKIKNFHSSFFHIFIDISYSTSFHCQPRPASCIPHPSIPFPAQQGCQSTLPNPRNRLHRVR